MHLRHPVLAKSQCCTIVQVCVCMSVCVCERECVCVCVSVHIDVKLCCLLRGTVIRQYRCV